jgi:integrase/recombinase XerD
VSWEAVRQRWLAELESRAYSPNTLEILEQWTQRLFEYLQALGVDDVVDVTRADLDAWRQKLSWSPGLRGRLYAACTVDQALRVTREFFRWAVAGRCLLVDPTAHWMLQRPPAELRPVLTVAEVARLLSAPDDHIPTGLRDRAILETLYSTALRLGECRRLDLDDLEWSMGLVRVRHGKGGRDRRVPLGPALGALLSRYLAESRPRLVKSPSETALFVGQEKGVRLSPIRYQQMVRDACAKAGVPRVSPHRLRHACAAHMLAGGASLHDVQRLLGHERLQTTYLYTQLCPEALAQVHQRTHPRARLSDVPPPEPPPEQPEVE